MDPNAALAEIREIVFAHTNGQSIDDVRLCDLIDGLDNWLTGGGFLPKEWSDVAGQ